MFLFAVYELPMKTSKFICSLTLATGLLWGSTPSLTAANYYFDPAAASSSNWSDNLWATPTNFAPYNQAWDNTPANNNVANFTTSLAGNYTVMLDAAQTVNFGSGGLDFKPTGSSTSLVINESGAGSKVVFDNGTIDIGTSGNFQTTFFADVSGNFTVTQGFVQMFSDVGYSGTATLNSSGRFLYFNSLESSSTDSNVVLNGGDLWFRGRPGTRQFGSLSGTGSGTVSLQIGPSSAPVDLTLASLSGNPAITLQTSGGALTSSLTVNQTSNTTYSGNIAGKNGSHLLTFAKSGSGTLRMDGSSLNLRLGTTASAGTLLINGGSTRSFENESGSDAISVANGGSFGGTSVLTIDAGDNVVVEDGGALTPGDGGGVAGRTSFSFAAGGSLDLSGVTSATGWLRFDLGADTTAGTTYDQIRVTDGTLNIGVLNFNDFAFDTTSIGGFDEGTYTLFDVTGSGTRSGSLGTLSGTVAPGYTGTLSLSGQNVLLTVVPEPATGLLVLVGVGAMTLLRRRRAVIDSRNCAC